MAYTEDKWQTVWFFFILWLWLWLRWSLLSAVRISGRWTCQALKPRPQSRELWYPPCLGLTLVSLGSPLGLLDVSPWPHPDLSLISPRCSAGLGSNRYAYKSFKSHKGPQCRKGHRLWQPTGAAVAGGLGGAVCFGSLPFHCGALVRMINPKKYIFHDDLYFHLRHSSKHLSNTSILGILKNQSAKRDFGFLSRKSTCQQSSCVDLLSETWDSSNEEPSGRTRGFNLVLYS